MNELSSLPPVAENQFLVKIASAFLCHSDMMAIAITDCKEPVTIGHEGFGYINKLHPSAEGKGSKGDLVEIFLFLEN